MNESRATQRGSARECGVLAPGLQGARYFEKIEKHIFMFQKNVKKITGVGTVDTHARDFFCLQICCILLCAKKTNSDRFSNFESGYVSSEICLLDLAQNKTNLSLKFGTLVDLGDMYT